MKKYLNIFGVSALFLAFMYLVYFVFSLYPVFAYSVASNYSIVLTIISYFVLFAQLLFFAGLVIVGREFKKSLLVYSAFVLFLLNLFSVSMSYSQVNVGSMVNIAIFVVSLLANVAIGVVIYTLGSKFGKLAKITGVIYVLFALFDLIGYVIGRYFIGGLSESSIEVVSIGMGVLRGFLTIAIYLLIGVIFFKTPKVSHSSSGLVLKRKK